ncbi:MAG: quinone-dependent dihydroorotate dehydrogenase, partial [Halobacteriovoraceae bacterium]|nr:quinone-dependent dihydroorotate dehydrogenase [Halobacteriovoraceae bacterium]
MYSWFRRPLFLLDPELAHNLTLKACARYPGLSRLFSTSKLDSRYQIKIGDGIWPSPVGLAAGLDKNAQAIDFFTRLPFGAVEVGTVTPRGQPGNDRPRLFRIKKEESLLNRMGFNNLGADGVLANIKKSPRNG